MAIYSTISITKDAAMQIMNHLEDPSLHEGVMKELKGMKGVEVKDLKIWTISSGKNEAILHVSADPSLLKLLSEVFERREITSTIQFDL